MESFLRTFHSCKKTSSSFFSLFLFHLSVLPRQDVFSFDPGVTGCHYPSLLLPFSFPCLFHGFHCELLFFFSLCSDSVPVSIVRVCVVKGIFFVLHSISTRLKIYSHMYVILSTRESAPLPRFHGVFLPFALPNMLACYQVFENTEGRRSLVKKKMFSQRVANLAKLWEERRLSLTCG